MKKLIICFAALATLLACNEKKVMQPSLTRQVSIVASSVDTKTTLSDNSVVWEANDAVSVWFSGEEVADHVANFKATSAGNVRATFTSTLPNNVTVAGGYDETAYAVYPAASMANDGTVTFTLPDEQEATETGSFASGLNLASAVVSLADLDEKGTTDASFKNAFSIIRFTVDEGMANIAITAEGAPLVGSAPMNFVTEGDDAGRLTVGTPVTSSNTVTLVPVDGQEAFTADKQYNFLVYPGTFSKLNVTLTDTDGCVYDRSLEAGTYTFAPSKFYTFNFNTTYVKKYTFTATGRTFRQDETIATVFSDDTKVVHEDVLTADAELKFTGKLPKTVVYGQNITGFAIWPSEAYAPGTDQVTYSLPADGTETINDLYSAALAATSTEVAFSSVESALAKIQFTVPAGVTSVKIASDKPLVGNAAMTVDADGKLVAGTGDASEINVASAQAKTYTLYVYPVAGAKFTVTLSNGTDTDSKDFADITVAAGATHVIDLSGFEFDKTGGFENEDFTEGGNYDFD